MAAKMAVPMVRKGALLPASVAVLAFVAVALAQVSLLVVVAVLAPISVALAWRRWL
jgi:hypothetical protein